MKTLADIKRRIKVGTKLEAVHASGHDFGIRDVSIVQSNAFALDTNGRNSWCDYPKASEVLIVDDNTFQILRPDKSPLLTYTFVE